MTVQEAYRILFTVAVVWLGLYMVQAFFRAVRGPELCDRILGVNMVGSGVNGLIAVLAIMLSEAWLLDIAIVYVLINVLSVAILAKVYIKTGAETNVEGKNG